MRMPPYPERPAPGFSYVELMVTLAIMAVLATVATPLLQIQTQRQKERELYAALTEIREAIDAYKSAAEQGRIVLEGDDSGYPKSLEQLVQGIEDQHSPTHEKIYFLRRIPADPMTSSPGDDPARTWGLRSYASPPDAPKAGNDIFDVYSRSDRIGLNGTSYRQW